MKAKKHQPMTSIAAAGLLCAMAITPAAGAAADDNMPGARSVKELEVYVVTLAQQFGVVNLKTGAFRPIGDGTPPLSNLVPGPDGMLFSLDSAGDLVSINPDNGGTTVIGPTGLGHFAATGESLAFALAEAGGKLYLTDFDNNLYHVNASTGHATLIGPTGMPPDPAVPVTFNQDGTLNLCGETLFGVGDKLYAIFNAFRIDPVTLAVTVEVAPKFWQIDPTSGLATLIGDSVGLQSSARVNGEFYGFRPLITSFSPFGPVAVNQLYRLDLDSGKASFLRNIDPAVSPIFGAAPVHGSSRLSRGESN
jgi:hypothetical protein